MKTHIDFETRSDIDLKKSGLHVYAASKHTDILCMAHATGDEPVQIWIPGQPFPKYILSGEIYAHNAAFEWELWNTVGSKKYGWPTLKIEQTHCNMVMGLTQGLPGSLEKLAIALNLKTQKDMAGSRVMLQLCKPRKILEDGTLVWWTKEEAPEKYEALYKYCGGDVDVEREAGKLLSPLTDKERQVWLLDHKINNRGIKVDLQSIEIASKLIEDEKFRMDAEMRSVTKLAVASCTAATQIKKFLESRGVELESVAKAEVATLLSSDLPPDCRRVLELRQEAAKSSTSKLTAMSLRASKDGRVRGTAQYHGAGTGRWAGRGIQVQNLPRNKISQKEIDLFFLLLKQKNPSQNIDMLIGPITSVVSDSLRGFITAEDYRKLYDVDYAAIEARVLAWLAGEESALEIFRTHGKKYEDAASKIYGVPLDKVTKDQRQIGKVADLALGFQGGVGALQSMASAYGLKLAPAYPALWSRCSDYLKNKVETNYLRNGKKFDIEKEEFLASDITKELWRESNKQVVKFWYALEEAAKNAINNPGKSFSVGKIAYRTSGSFLMCRLPSSRILYYPFPKLETVKNKTYDFEKETIVYMTEDSLSRKWSKSFFYGGLAAENITQAVARDILAEGLLRLEANEYPVVMHVHDEVLVEMENGTVDEMSAIMCVLPSWATGLPIQAEGWEAKRYMK